MVTLAGTPLAEGAAALLAGAGWELLFSTLLFAAVALLVRLRPLTSPAVRQALWGLVLLRLVLPPELAAPGSARDLMERAVRLSAAFLGSSAAGVEEADGGGLPIQGGQAGGLAPSPAPAWAPALVGLWLAGSLVCGLGLVRRRAVYRRLLQRSRPVGDPRVTALARRWRRRFGIRRRVRLVTAEAPISAFTSGLLRPVIFLPEALLGSPDRRWVEAAIAHEMAHVRRWDALWLGLRNLVQVVYFFHPVARAAAARMNREGERLCDRLVLAGGFPRRAYAASLLFNLQLNTGGDPAVAAFANAKRRQEMRIRDILHGRVPTRPRSLPALAVATLAGLFLLPMASPSSPAAADPSGATLGLALSNPLPGARVTSPFGERRDPFGQALQEHRGVDLHARRGEGVRAATAGVVEVATTRYAGGEHHGTVVVLDHGEGLKTFYSHLDSLAVEAGRRVAEGELLGGAGITGAVTGPHLHFEVWRDGVPVDPARYVAGWR